MAATQVDGYRGIWFTLGQFSEYGDKYSGGLGTYTAKHVPMAVHAPEANKTFFVYGGVSEAGDLLNMISFYDHETGRVPQPTLVHAKCGVDDPHDDPTLCIDGHGHVWVFVAGRGRKRPGFLYRSAAPYSIDEFEFIREEPEMAYPQPRWIPGRGFIHLFTKYAVPCIRELFWNTSPDGREWTAHRPLAAIDGHYQTSCQCGERVMTAFNLHPEQGNCDKRTNLYYVETGDFGQSWRTAAGEALATPITDVHSPSLVYDFAADGRLVYLKDINYDSEGRPAILVVTSAWHEPGPAGDPRQWTLARWTGQRWDLTVVTTSTHNYDNGSLHIDGDDWRIIAPTEPGPQYHGTGGEMALWVSSDAGATWARRRQVTAGSPMNHSYARRPVNAHPDFFTFWTDGNPDERSDSSLYFTNRDGDRVYRLPRKMNEPWAEPEPVR